MIDILIKLEDALVMSEIDYEFVYVPDCNGYILRIDGDKLFISNIKEASK